MVNREYSPRRVEHPVSWSPVRRGWAISLLGTLLLGLPLFALQQNVWWIALAGVLSLFAGGVYAGWRSREPEPLYGALVAVLYFGLVAAVFFAGEMAEVFPDPLPGLAVGDSTFFFVWPLLQLAAAVAGSVTGCRLTRRRGEGTPGMRS